MPNLQTSFELRELEIPSPASFFFFAADIIEQTLIPPTLLTPAGISSTPHTPAVATFRRCPLHSPPVRRTEKENMQRRNCEECCGIFRLPNSESGSCKEMPIPSFPMTEVGGATWVSFGSKFSGSSFWPSGGCCNHGESQSGKYSPS